jgi:hypothetical protein
MNKQAQRNSSKTSFIWKMQIVHINLPVHSRASAHLKPRSAGTRHYVPWLYLVAMEI